MHPDIKKFWETAGYKVTCKRPVNPQYAEEWRDLWYSYKDLKFDIIGVSAIQNGFSENTPDELPCVIYFLHNIEYTEEKFLKIIKLTAFL